MTDRAGNVTTIQRDGQGNPVAIVGPFGQTTALTLDGNGYLASITNPNGEAFSMEYQPPVAGDGHGLGLLTRLTDPRLGVHSMQYDPDGFLANDTRPDGSSETLARGGDLGATHVTRSTGLGRTTTYNVSWNPITGAETSSIASPDGTTSTTTTKTDHSVAASFPDGMSVTTTTAPDPRFGMDAFAVSSTTKTPAGLTRTVTISRTATLASSTDPLTLSSLIESVTVNGRTSQRSYNGTTRRMTLTSAAGRVTTVDYDALGRVTQIVPPGVQPLVLHYDGLGRNDSITQGTRVTQLSYRSDGFLASILDPLQRTTSFDYDLAGRPISSTLPDLSVIGSGYDANGNVTSVTPPGRLAHAFNYTPADLESDYTPPDVGQPRTTHTDYDLDQQVSGVSRPDGDFITPTYDPGKGRLTAVTTSRGTATLGYSPTTGQVTSVTTPDGAGLTYTYDGALLKSVTSSGPIAGSVQRSYDTSFRVSSETYGGQTISYGYDNDDLLTSAGAMTIARSSATGFVSDATLGSVTDTRTYDAFGEEQSYSSSFGTTSVYSVDYGTRDALGRIVSKTETVQGETHVFGYSYDAQGRLTDVTRDGAATSHYDYDANGNRTVAPGLTASPVYDNQDRLLSYGTCTYGYKPDGSLQTKTCPDGTTSYEYDAFGSLRHVTLPNGTSIDYVIDRQNRRIGNKVNGALAEGFLYRNQLQPAAWLNGDGTVRATFVYGLHANVPEYMVQGATTYRLITDQVGSVRLVVDASTGMVAERIDWDEFGNVLSDTAPGTQPFGFAGGLRDVDTGLTRFGARDYDAVTARWTAKDPLRFGGGLADLYGYVGNDPINKIDPKGLNVTNNSGCPLVVKGEEDSTEPRVILPGQSWDYRDDGFYLSNGNVFKVPDWVDATVNPDGSVTTYVSPAVPWNSTQYYKSVPGRWFWSLWGNVVANWKNPNDPFLRKNTNWPQPGDVQRMFNSTGAGPGCGCTQ